MAEFPGFGAHCSVDECHQLDFLPVKCDACTRVFCKNHFSYDKHQCPSAFAKDCQVPVCPLCNAPVPTPRGVAPDVQVDRHIAADCRSLNKPKIYTNRCAKPGCRRREMVPVTCGRCKRNFCLAHRSDFDHDCEAIQSTSRGTRFDPRPCAKEARMLNDHLTEDEALARALADSAAVTDETDEQMARRLQREEYEQTRAHNPRTFSTSNSQRQCCLQ